MHFGRVHRVLYTWPLVCRPSPLFSLAPPARKREPPAEPPVQPPADELLKQEGLAGATRALQQAAEADNFATAIASCGYSTDLSRDLLDHAKSCRESYTALTVAIRARPV